MASRIRNTETVIQSKRANKHTIILVILGGGMVTVSARIEVEDEA